jgi:hypothetical protein
MLFGLSSLGHDFGCTKDDKLNQSDVFRMTSYLQSEVSHRCFRENAWRVPQLYTVQTPANRRHRRERTLLREAIRVSIGDNRVGGRQGRFKGPAAKRSDGFRWNFTEMSDGSYGLDDYHALWSLRSSSLGLCYHSYLLAKHPTYQTECALEAQKY